MPSRENCIREALSELEEQRAKNLAEEQRRRDEASARSPRIGELLLKRHSLFADSMRRAFADPKTAADLSGRLSSSLTEINQSLRTELIRSGFPEDYLQPICRCRICRDTGYVGEPIHEQCSCLRQAVMKKMYAGEGLRALEQENFSTFRENLFEDIPVEGHKSTQRGYLRKVRDSLEKYADEFSPETQYGILLCGKSGLGKTFLMNCVAERVLSRGFSVVIVSAYRLLEAMRRYQFDNEGAGWVADILSCDLLAIDDLGSEPMLGTVSVSSIYHILNERRCSGKPILVTTNSDINGLYTRYDDRVGARLTDPSRMKVITLFGSDVRKRLRAN